jgi:phytoene/squalene synthetase
MKKTIPEPKFAPSITRSASSQTYYTIRFLVDRERVLDAYRAYAYFRWVDDTLDAGDFALSGPAGTIQARERTDFLARQQSLLEKCYRGETSPDATREEKMLIDLVAGDSRKNSGLQSYLRNMMKVMDFDARRRGRWVAQAELNDYTRWLAGAVTEALHYFIGHDRFSPHDETRYLAVTAAHITHMLRDTYDDVQAGYYNIPREVLEAGRIQPRDIGSKAYRDWVCSRVRLARECFMAGRNYLARVENPRCQLAGFAYTARFEWLLDTIEQEGYLLRPAYSERKSPATGLRMGLSTLSSLIHLRGRDSLNSPFIPQSLRKS